MTVTLVLERTDGGAALLIGPATIDVITEILPGVKATAKKDTVRTRGGEASATLTVAPGYKGAFETGQRVEVEFEGIPENVTVMVAAADAKPPNTDAESDPPVLSPAS